MEGLLVQLLEGISSPSSPQVAEASQAKLLELLDAPEMFPALVSLVAGGAGPVFRKYALVLLRRIVLKNGLKTYEGCIDTLKAVLCQTLLEQGEYETKRSCCDLIEVVGPTLIPTGNWGQLCELIPGILNSQLDVGFYLMERIFVSLPEEMQESLVPPLVSAFVGSVGSADVNVRINGMRFFGSFASNVDDPSILGAPEIIAALKNGLVTAISNGNEKEVSVVVDVVCQLCNPHYEFFLGHVPEFMSFALEMMKKDIALNIRVLVHQIVDEGVKVCDESHKEALDGTVQLALQVCADDRSSNDYKFAWCFFEFLSLDMLQYIFECAKHLLGMKTPVSIQVALFMLSSVIEINAPLVLDFANELIQIISSLLSMNDEYIFRDSDELLTEIVSIRPQCLSSILDDIVMVYLGRPPVFYKSLDLILLSAERPTTHSQAVIEHMMRVIAEPSLQAFKCDAINCISSVLVKQRSAGSQYDQLAAQLLSSTLASDTDVRPEFLSLISAMVRTSPNVIKSQLDTIFELIISSASQNQYRTMKEAVQAITWIFRRLPQTVQGRAEQIYQLLWRMDQLTFDPEFEMNEEQRDQFFKLKSQAVLSLSWFVKIFQAHQDTVIPLIMEQIRDDANACEAASICLAFIPDKSVILTLDEIPFSCLRSIIEDVGVGDALDSVLTRIMAELMETESLKCLDTLVTKVGAAIAPKASVISGSLFEMIQNTNSGEIQGYALKCLTSLAVVCKNTEIITQIVPVLLSKCKSSNVSLVRNVLGSFRLIITAQHQIPELATVVEVACETVKQGVQGSLFDEASAVLLLANHELDLPTAQTIFAKLLLTDDTFSVVAQSACEMFAKFGDAFISEMSKVAVTALTSSDFIWDSLSEQVRGQMKLVIRHVGVETVMKILNFDEWQFAQMQRRMS